MQTSPIIQTIVASLTALTPTIWLGGCAVAVVAWGAWRARGRWIAGADERTLKRRQRIAEQAEIDAAGVLRSSGYHILDAQVEHHWTVMLDGEPHSIELRADYLVSRGPRRYVAEVKSGRSAPSISTAATRRQLLEYRVAYPVDGILLVDMEAVAIHVVDFGGKIGAKPRRDRSLATLIVGALFGAITVVMLMRFGLL